MTRGRSTAHPGTPRRCAEPHALFVGHIVETEERRNTVTGNPFRWALVDTLGGTFDVVIDPELLPDPPRVGNILSGWFWLSGRLRLDDTPKGWKDVFKFGR